MSDFISWIEYRKEILYLTSKDLDTSAGKRLLKEVGVDDIKGHGAIRKFFNIAQDKGTNKECLDFSSPDNFPKDIVRDIKRGLFVGFGVAQDVLKQSASEEYRKIRHSAWVEYEKIRQSTRGEYEKIKESAWVKYRKIVGTAFWNLVKIKSNRAKKWR